MAIRAEKIKKVTVLGAGVMGSGISAHLANAGISSYLIDAIPDKSKQALDGILKSRPPLAYLPSNVKRIEPGDLDKNLGWIGEVDWVIEAATENLKIKLELLGKIEEARKPGAIVTTNTSGISLAEMAANRSEDFRKHFMVTHFFNPVRYMKLMEIVKGEDTDPGAVDTMVEMTRDILGKGVVYAKDTPNFIGNRVGIYGIMEVVKALVEEGYKVEEIDAIFGAAMGRPNSAVFRTADLVGLDTFSSVSMNVYDKATDDEKRDYFKVPGFLEKMIGNGWLGNKTKQGFYRREGKEFLVIDIDTLEYRPQEKFKYGSLSAAKGIDDIGERIKSLVWADDRAAKLAWKVTAGTLIYAANRIPEIADDIVNIDNAMKWGFNWKLGPFETWDAIGVKESVDRMEREGMEVPALARDVLAKGNGRFYSRQDGRRKYFDVSTKSEVLEEIPETLIILQSLKEQKKTVKENMGASLVDLGDGVACLEFHTKMNSIDDDIIAMIRESLTEVEKNFAGLVITNDADHFSVGANLMLVLMEARQKNWDRLEEVVKDFQDANEAIKRSSKPVVVAPFGQTLGGGCEIAMAGAKTRAHAELYIGLVEVGVGLIPGGGGNKEVLLRAKQRAKAGGPFPYVRDAFETIAFAKVSSSAHDAQKTIGILRPSDEVTLSRDRLIHDAKQDVLALSKSYAPPEPVELELPGRGGQWALISAVGDLIATGQATEHDLEMAKLLAKVLAGGDEPTLHKATEQHLLDLEREAFISLCGMEKSQARMEHMLMRGKPLRN